jgi:hypothetical protein
VGYARHDYLFKVFQEEVKRFLPEGIAEVPLTEPGMTSILQGLFMFS